MRRFPRARTRIPDQGETRSAYDAIAHPYGDRWFDIRLHEDMARFVGRLAPGVRVLDVGCGPGRDTAWLVEQGYDAYGVDLSLGMLRAARQRGLDVPVAQADMRRLPFPKGAFRGLWVCASLLHIPKTEASGVLRELERVVHPGHIYVAVKRGEGEAWVEDSRGIRRLFAYYHPDELQLLMERSGFEVLSCWENADSAGRARPWINVLAWSKIETPRSGVSAVVLDERGHVLLTRRADNGAWCLPGGHLDYGETVEQCAVREVREETGLQVSVERLVGVYSTPWPPDPDVPRPRHYVVLHFACRVVGGEIRLSEETTEVRYFAPDALPEDLFAWHRVRIADALSGSCAPVIR
ncbi:MAG: NUDIX domain-containing protein [Anaerolineae bacterium]|nr:NUDIX domain-containing protein [Anaerolineae bacterium]